MVKKSWIIQPIARAHWLHEFLDTSTSVTGSIAGPSFVAQGLGFGRDWALLGLGAVANQNRCVSFYANYNLQINEHQRFHIGTGGIVWRR
jgi:outer membrane autotransporter protein